MQEGLQGVWLAGDFWILTWRWFRNATALRYSHGRLTAANAASIESLSCLFFLRGRTINACITSANTWRLLFAAQTYFHTPVRLCSVDQLASSASAFSGLCELHRSCRCISCGRRCCLSLLAADCFFSAPRLRSPLQAENFQGGDVLCGLLIVFTLGPNNRPGKHSLYQATEYHTFQHDQDHNSLITEFSLPADAAHGC